MVMHDFLIHGSQVEVTLGKGDLDMGLFQRPIGCCGEAAPHTDEDGYRGPALSMKSSELSPNPTKTAEGAGTFRTSGCACATALRISIT